MNESVKQKEEGKEKEKRKGEWEQDRKEIGCLMTTIKRMTH